MRARLGGVFCVTLAACMALAACHRSPPADNDILVLNAANVSQLVALPPKPTASRAPTVAETPIAIVPANDVGPNPQLSRPAFQDPPLPAELTSDNGLVPLPPPPPPSAFQGEHH